MTELEQSAAIQEQRQRRIEMTERIQQEKMPIDKKREDLSAKAETAFKTYKESYDSLLQKIRDNPQIKLFVDPLYPLATEFLRVFTGIRLEIQAGVEQPTLRMSDLQIYLNDILKKCEPQMRFIRDNTRSSFELRAAKDENNDRRPVKVPRPGASILASK